MYAKVVIEYPVKALDHTYVYKIPDELKIKIRVGHKVIVPFNTSTINGFVLELTNDCQDDFLVKEIIDIVDEELVMSSELLAILNYLTEVTLCTKITAFQTMLPSSLKAKTQNQNYVYYETYISLNKDSEIDILEYMEKNKRYEGQINILKTLLEEEKVLKNSLTNSGLSTLLKKNIVVEEKVQKYRINKENILIEDKVLTDEQERAYQKIMSEINSYKTFLLYGVTGSGKTEVYIKLIKEVIKNGKTALVLVPEISLTTQIAARFYASFGSKVAILHSSLSAGEKYDEYLKILRSEVDVVVGTRSSVFAPLKNLGIIIIDEEDSSSYKQDTNPRYHAKDIAMFRAKYNNIPLVLGSATPSLETKARADKKVFELVKLSNRVGKAKLPIIHIVDMEEEMKKRNMIFSDLLRTKIEEKLNNKEQIILLLNRRGFSTFINCSNCGFVYKCPSCDISLTYHKTSNNLLCHYCGYTIKKNDKCPKCLENSLNYYGLGTEKLEQELNKCFPNARIIRMDQDVTQRKGAHEKIINSFKNEEYDILLGTQMVSKGLDFPKVSLVGVINADTTLNIPDFRSNENTYSLLSQVAGRAGRSDIEGEVIIQTFNPDNYVINCVKENNYEKFYLYEMNFRKNLKYPPYYYLIGIKVIGKSYEETLNEAKKVKCYIENNIEKTSIVLGPTTAAVLKYKNEYRFQIIIKYQFDNKLINTLKELDKIYINNKSCYIDIDFNPIKI